MSEVRLLTRLLTPRPRSPHARKVRSLARVRFPTPLFSSVFLRREGSGDGMPTQGQERVAAAPRIVAPAPRVWVKGTVAPRVGSTSMTRRATAGLREASSSSAAAAWEAATPPPSRAPDGRAFAGCCCLVTQPSAEPRGRAGCTGSRSRRRARR
jgi:hypothetical protein